MQNNIYTYWENSSARTLPPPYVILGLASMRRVFGENFIIVTPRNLSALLGDLPESKEWTFGNNGDPQKSEVRSIVAKSDFLRMKFVHDLGGYWLDADTVLLQDFRTELDRQLAGDRHLLWHSEAFFGARPGNEILRKACANMLGRQNQTWGNPGDLKTLVADHEGHVKKISFNYIGTGFSPEYSYKTQEVMLRTDVSPGDFLRNKEQRVLKLYNTPLSGTGFGSMAVSEFLESDILLARIFLSIESKDYWLENSQAIIEDVER